MEALLKIQEALQEDAARQAEGIALIRQGLALLEGDVAKIPFTSIKGGQVARATVEKGQPYRKNFGERVPAYLIEHGAANPAEIAKALGVKTQAIDSFLFREVRRAVPRVKRLGDGKYEASAAARKAMKQSA